MANCYICGTYWHILYTIARINTVGEDTIILIDTTPHVNDLQGKLEKAKLFKSVEVWSCDDFSRSFLFFRFYKPKFSQSIRFFLSSFQKIFLFNENMSISNFFLRKRMAYHLIEDGRNAFSTKKYRKESFYQKQKLFFRGLGTSKILGSSNCCKSIEVNDMSLLENDPRSSKVVDRNVNSLLKHMPAFKTEAIKDIFSFQSFSLEDKSDKVLIITQPLYEDAVFKEFDSEKKQMDFYRSLVDEYSDKYDVYIKIHPRDLCDYSQVKNCKVLGKDYPIELLNYGGDNVFTLAITYSLTSLDNLSCAKEENYTLA